MVGLILSVNLGLSVVEVVDSGSLIKEIPANYTVLSEGKRSVDCRQFMQLLARMMYNVP
jgi:hypothetical protein